LFWEFNSKVSAGWSLGQTSQRRFGRLEGQAGDRDELQLTKTSNPWRPISGPQGSYLGKTIVAMDTSTASHL
jgi:hypothetical protein